MNAMGGVGAAEEGNSLEFPESFSYGKFQAVSTTGNLWRWTASFSYVTGSSTTAGDFSVGMAIYPFSLFPAIPVQPFLAVGGESIIANIDSTYKLLFGYSVSSGVDLRFGKSFGLGLQVEYVNASIGTFRYGGGFIIYFGKSGY